MAVQPSWQALTSAAPVALERSSRRETPGVPRRGRRETRGRACSSHSDAHTTHVSLRPSSFHSPATHSRRPCRTDPPDWPVESPARSPDRVSSSWRTMSSGSSAPGGRPRTRGNGMKKVSSRTPREPSRSSLRDIPEVDFGRAKVRRNPYARRIAANGISVHVARGRPRKGTETGVTIPRSIRFPASVCNRSTLDLRTC